MTPPRTPMDFPSLHPTRTVELRPLAESTGVIPRLQRAADLSPLALPMSSSTAAGARAKGRGMRNRIHLGAMVMALFVATSLTGQESKPAPESNPAEELLKSLQRRRSAGPVIPPAGVPNMEALKPKKALWPEGHVVVERLGVLRQDGAWWRFNWTDAPDEPSVRLLPNATLEEMIRTGGSGEVLATLMVSGEMTVFEHENYLLATVALRTSANEVPSSEPRPKESSPALATDANVEDVLKLMQSQRPPENLIVQNRGSAPARSSISKFPPLARLQDGTPITRRPGRLVRSGERWSFVFESDHPGQPEPPLEILPNRNLERMLEISQRDSAGLVFLTSGEATAFEGRNLYFIRSVVRHVDLGNLNK